MHMHADFTSTSELPFVSLAQVIVLNVSHENGLIFMEINKRTGDLYIHTNSFAQILVLLQRQK